jgi:hypothetical protein
VSLEGRWILEDPVTQIDLTIFGWVWRSNFFVVDLVASLFHVALEQEQ